MCNMWVHRKCDEFIKDGVLFKELSNSDTKSYFCPYCRK